MIQPVASPQASRAATSSGSEGASPQATTIAVDAGGGEGDAEIFAEAVADRADHQLHRAVRQQVGGDHDRGGADGDIAGRRRSAAAANRSTRTMAWAAKEASASSVMALVALPLGWGWGCRQS